MRKRIIKLTMLSLLVVLLAVSCSPVAATQTPAPSPTQPPAATLPQATAVPPTAVPTNTQPPAPTATQAPAATDTQPAAALDGKALVTERCSACHSLGRVTSKTESLSEWTEIVDNMISRGADLSADERAAVIAFLAATYK